MSENLASELATAIATVEKDYMEAKAEAKAAKDEADQALAARYFAEAQEPNLEELSEIFGKSVSTVTALAKAAGVELGTGKRGRPSRFTEDEQKNLAEAFANAKTKTDVYRLAADNEVSPETLKGWAVRHGFVTVKTRTKQDA